MTQPQVVVIGSGAGGAAFAWALADAGVQVQILEAGPSYNPRKDYLLDTNQWEQQMFPEKVPIAGRQTHAPFQLLEDRWADLRSWNHILGQTVTSDRRSFVTYSHVIGVGGSTLHFTGETHRMNPQSMKMKSRFGVAADWPFDYAELEPYYVEAERIYGIAGPSDPGVRTRSAPYPLPAHELSYASQKLGEGCRKLGLSWMPNSVASLSRAYDRRPPCNYCGNCTRGCPRKDKGSADLTFIAKAVATGNCTVTPGAYVLRLLPGPDDRIRAVVYAGTHGQKRVEADYFAVACGAVETPRLLLNSSPAGSSDGLANESGLLGRNFMETLFWSSSGLHPEPLGSHRGLPSDAICWDFNAPDAIPGVIGGCRLSPSTAESNMVGPVNYARRVVGGWGRSHKASMREQFGHMLSIGGIGENLPDKRSFIDLDPDEKDAFNLPKARIHSHLADMELERLRFIAKTCRRILKASGVPKILEEGGTYDGFMTTHVFGTCRMGTEPKTSVVDDSCRSHRWRNLLVTDASVFPSTGGGESPALTISALALRAARKLMSSMG